MLDLVLSRLCGSPPQQLTGVAHRREVKGHRMIPSPTLGMGSEPQGPSAA